MMSWKLLNTIQFQTSVQQLTEFLMYILPLYIFTCHYRPLMLMTSLKFVWVRIVSDLYVQAVRTSLERLVKIIVLKSRNVFLIIKNVIKKVLDTKCSFLLWRMSYSYLLPHNIILSKFLWIMNHEYPILISCVSLSVFQSSEQRQCLMFNLQMKMRGMFSQQNSACLLCVNKRKWTTRQGRDDK